MAKKKKTGFFKKLALALAIVPILAELMLSGPEVWEVLQQELKALERRATDNPTLMHVWTQLQLIADILNRKF
jgi:hypothetical protein